MNKFNATKQEISSLGKNGKVYSSFTELVSDLDSEITPKLSDLSIIFLDNNTITPLFVESINQEKYEPYIFENEEDLEISIVDELNSNQEIKIGWYKLKFLVPNTYETLYLKVHGKNGNENVIGGNASLNYTWYQWEVREHETKINKLILRQSLIDSVTPTATSVKLVIAKPATDPTKLEMTQIIDIPFDFSSNELDLRIHNIILPPYYSIGLKALPLAGTTPMYTNQTLNPYPDAPKTNYFLPSDTVGTISTTYTSTLSFSYAFEFTMLIPREPEDITMENKIDVNDMTTIMVMGSSLTSAHYAPANTTPLERISDLSDINLVNNAVSSKNLVDNINSITSNTPIAKDTANTPAQLRPKYIWWGNSANGTPEGLLGLRQLLIAKEVTHSMGAEMLLGSEEDYSSKAIALEATYKSFSKEYNVPYSPMIKIWRNCFPSGLPYSGWLATNHSGYRGYAPYLTHLDLINNIYIHKNIKMFKVRPMYKLGSPTINDLTYDDIIQRNQKFYSISAGLAASINTNHADSLDSTSYDVTGGSTGGTILSEVSAMQRLAPITFTKWGLIEIIAEKIKMTRTNFSVETSVNPTSVYLAISKNSLVITPTAGTAQNEGLDTIRTTFISVPFTYDVTTKKVNIVVNREDYDFQLYDKVRILIQAPSTFTMTNPILYNYNGVDKEIQNSIYNKYNYRKFGLELNPNVSFPSSSHGWTLAGGSIIAELPTEIANYTGYTTQKSHLEMPSDTSTATKSIPITQPTTKVAVRIASCNWRPIATTRFIGTPIENSPYIDATKPVYTRYEYDYTILQVTFNNRFVKTALVQTGWNEIYFEVDVDPTDTSLSIKLERKAFVDSSYDTEQYPMFVHAVSVQKID